MTAKTRKRKRDKEEEHRNELPSISKAYMCAYYMGIFVERALNT